MAGPIAWQLSTVTGIHDETPSVRTFTLALPSWPGTELASTSTCA